MGFGKMENKKAIEFLNERIKLIKKEYPGITYYKDALETAIKALEYCEKMGVSFVDEKET